MIWRRQGLDQVAEVFVDAAQVCGAVGLSGLSSSDLRVEASLIKVAEVLVDA